jgi:hypothetical protein
MIDRRRTVAQADSTLSRTTGRAYRQATFLPSPVAAPLSFIAAS